MQSEAAGKPEIPQNVFVGSFDGHSCWPDSEVYDVWPKFIINFYLEGRQRFVIDNIAFKGDAGHGAESRPQVLMVNIKQYSKLYFVESDAPNTRLRKVMTSAPLPWLEREMGMPADRSPALEDFFSRHLSHFAFEPSRELIELAEQISHPPANLKGEMRTLYNKSRGIEIMRLSCAALVASAEEAEHRPLVMSARQSERVRDYILANLSNNLTIETIARETGASASSVQRHFKQRFGMTVFDFIRRKRLDAARDALEREGVTVMQAAWIAGYLSPSSFITAFKKTYGAPPGLMRA
ncbi:AraC family transcriptional regulator [Hyphomicrobium sp. LHD-15]|uniref:AraC family transcriptional regulator n=1 Tax=Hyphomicrobium sp. LHD-15 TaxID=3072142 RepID=UPI0028103225|nr:AraC family transcriptional regulator [Hyphomicrobium sp. LHD-15]MDQ8697604.1 AraC family transcriptional regulator [Hyphomicrobium sp. LHD-15]